MVKCCVKCINKIMSRIGKQVIDIPNGVEVTTTDGVVKVKYN